MSVLIEFSIFPIGQGENLSAKISEVVAMIRNSGYDYQLTAMGTIIETNSVSEALELVDKSYKVLETLDCPRVYASIKMDIREGQSGRLSRKVVAIKSRIGSVDT
jgi:uncharacterized protein (TIGR00106 family)